KPHVREGLKKLEEYVSPTARIPSELTDHGSGGPYYFLFSLERVAVILDLKKIGDTDWYDWGARALVQQQQKGGFWPAYNGNYADTCFALLFLKRANVAWDLAPVLAKPIRRDPSRVNPVDSKDLFKLPMLIPKKESAKEKSEKDKSEKDKSPP